MREYTLLLVAVLCAAPLWSQDDEGQHPHVKYTKKQRQAAGFWRVIEADERAHIPWLVISLGDSPGAMTVRWPTGLGCQFEPAQMRGETITVLRQNFPAVIRIDSSKNATVSLFGGQTVFHIKKTKESTDFVCE